jgi:hypothetical protein
MPYVKNVFVANYSFQEQIQRLLMEVDKLLHEVALIEQHITRNQKVKKSYSKKDKVK